MSEPLVYSIEETRIKEWAKWVSEALTPRIEFNKDPQVMLKDAYDFRTDKLVALHNALHHYHQP